MANSKYDRIQNFLKSLTFEDKTKILNLWESIQPPPKLYECWFQLGRSSNRNPMLWVQSAEFLGNSLVVNFSDEKCLISEELAKAVASLLQVADRGDHKKIVVSYGCVDDPVPFEEVSGDE